MPWGYRRNQTRSRSSFPKTAWNTRGETCSLNNALTMFGLTEDQVQNANPPINCQWRSCHGNPYAVVKISEMRELKRRIEKEDEEKKVKKLIETMGKAAYEKMLAEEDNKKEAEEKARKEAAERKRNADLIKDNFLALMKFPPADQAATIDNIQIAKTKAKSEWGLRDMELNGLASTVVGKSTYFKLRDVIAAAEKRDGSAFNRSSLSLEGRVRGNDRTSLYAIYLRDKFNTFAKSFSDELIKEACESARASIQKEIDDAVNNVKLAEKELENKKLLLLKRKSRLESVSSYAESLGVSSHDTAAKFPEEGEKPAVLDKENHFPSQAHKKVRVV